MKSLANEFFKTMADGARKHQSSQADEFNLIVNGIKDERDLARPDAVSKRRQHPRSPSSSADLSPSASKTPRIHPSTSQSITM